MFRKALGKALPRSSRAFHLSPSVTNLVAANLAQAEEVKVRNSLQPTTRRFFSPFHHSLGHRDSTR